jgi:hypothetical protein
VGFDPVKQLVKVRNSWSPNWAQNGYGYFKVADFVADSADMDLWIVRHISQPSPSAATAAAAAATTQLAKLQTLVEQLTSSIKQAVVFYSVNTAAHFLPQIQALAAATSAQMQVVVAEQK